MAVEKTRSNLPSLTPDQLDTARALYLRRGATIQWVAAALGVSSVSVRAACHREQWDYEKNLREAARTARAKPNAERQTEIEAEQDECHAALARREIELRKALVEKAAAAVGDMTPREAMRALRAVSGSKDLQFVERLARDRKTDKTETTTSEVAQALHDVAAALDRAEGVDPADAEGVGDDAPGPGVDSPRGPEAGSS
jgi:transposase-like protein